MFSCCLGGGGTNTTDKVAVVRQELVEEKNAAELIKYLKLDRSVLFSELPSGGTVWHVVAGRQGDDATTTLLAQMVELAWLQHPPAGENKDTSEVKVAAYKYRLHPEVALAVDKKNRAGRTALMEACSQGNTKAAAFLLAQAG